MKRVVFVAEPKQRIAKNKALAKNILHITLKDFAISVFVRSKKKQQKQIF